MENTNDISLLKENFKKLKRKVKAKLWKAEREVSVMKKKLSEKASAEEDLKRELALLKVALRVGLRRKEELFSTLSKQKENSKLDNIKIKTDLRQEMEKELSVKNEEIEKLLSENQRIENVITIKDTNCKLLEKQLKSIEANKLTRAYQIREDIIQSIEKELECCICKELFTQPMTLNCSHSFCSTCISTWSKSQDSCPICRTTIAIFTKPLIIDSCINKLTDVFPDKKKAGRYEIVEERKNVVVPLPFSRQAAVL